MDTKNQESQAFNPNFDGLKAKDVLGVVGKEIKEEFSPVVKASKVVFDKSVELVGPVLKNTDRIAGLGLFLGSGVAGFVAINGAVTSAIDAEFASKVFSNLDRFQTVVALAGISTSSYFTAFVGNNLMHRRSPLDKEGLGKMGSMQ